MKRFIQGESRTQSTLLRLKACSSVVERYLYKVEVGCSIQSHAYQEIPATHPASAGFLYMMKRHAGLYNHC